MTVEIRRLPSNFIELFSDSFSRFLLFLDDFFTEQTLRENGLSQGGERILGEPNAGGSSDISEASSFDRFHYLFGATLEKVRTNEVCLGHIYISPTVKLSPTKVPSENYNKIKVN